MVLPFKIRAGRSSSINGVELTSVLLGSAKWSGKLEMIASLFVMTGGLNARLIVRVIMLSQWRRLESACPGIHNVTIYHGGDLSRPIIK